MTLISSRFPFTTYNYIKRPLSGFDKKKEKIRRLLLLLHRLYNEIQLGTAGIKNCQHYSRLAFDDNDNVKKRIRVEGENIYIYEHNPFFHSDGKQVA